MPFLPVSDGYLGLGSIMNTYLNIAITHESLITILHTMMVVDNTMSKYDIFFYLLKAFEALVEWRTSEQEHIQDQELTRKAGREISIRTEGDVDISLFPLTIFMFYLILLALLRMDAG